MSQIRLKVAAQLEAIHVGYRRGAVFGVATHKSITNSGFLVESKIQV